MKNEERKMQKGARDFAFSILHSPFFIFQSARRLPPLGWRSSNEKMKNGEWKMQKWGSPFCIFHFPFSILQSARQRFVRHEPDVYLVDVVVLHHQDAELIVIESE